MKVNRLRNCVRNFKDSVWETKQWHSFRVQIFNLYCDFGTHLYTYIYYLRHDIKGFNQYLYSNLYL